MSYAAQGDRRSDALVLFGATGDLAYKEIFPALYAMTKRGALTVPVIGVAYSHSDLTQLQARVRASIAQEVGTIDEAAVERLVARFAYIDGDYNDPSTSAALPGALHGAEHPALLS